MDLVRKAVVVFIFIAVYKFNCTFCVEHQTEFYNLKVGQVLEHFNAEGEEKLSVYCFQGHQKRSPHKILASLTFRISSSTSDFELLSAPNASIIYDDYHTARSTWFKFTRAITPIRREMVHVPLFQQSCVGVVSKSNFKVILTEQWVDFWRLIFMVLSVICFWKAKELSSSTTFYYSFGTSVGVMSSVLLISFFLFNRIPRKNIAIGVILSGVSLTSYIISLLYNNFMEKLIKYRYYFIVYVVLSAAVSFGLIYRFQPGRHPRSMDLFRWTLQALSLLVLFYSSEMREFSVLVILGLLTIKAIPEGLKNALTRSINNLW
ncbi:unnamed protein product [Cyprideis torosa]|uniref:Uncharacterized protein n=1 Tax=Cyprideis torosa TaxID=163714 RepID=A0A7R8WQK9_9CRUS|nr:unnamed protein product [Cyprideis torosa]CAG0908052.1 unnamed protein product [Cyprideis torosa]